jgi:hypothetical protein
MGFSLYRLLRDYASRFPLNGSFQAYNPHGFAVLWVFHFIAFAKIFATLLN